MSDNPRPELYGARYPVRAVRQSAACPQPITVVGRHCEAGDVLAVDVPLAADIWPELASQSLRRDLIEGPAGAGRRTAPVQATP